MSTFVRVISGLIAIGIGVFLVIRTRSMLSVFGPIEWAEAKLGGGGSNLLYKVVGLVFCVIGIILVTGLWDAFLQATLGSILPHVGPDGV